MDLLLVRFQYSATTTLGRLSIQAKPECYTLEPQLAPNATSKGAIPESTYIVTIDFSARFNTLMPHVMNVPGFEGIRIHSGNTAYDTEGCILVGETWGPDHVYNSRIAFNHLFLQLKSAIARSELVSLKVTKEQP